MTDLIDERIRRAVTELVEAAPPAPPLPDRAQAKAGLGQRATRRVIAAVAAVVLVLAAGSAVLALRHGRANHEVVTAASSIPARKRPTAGQEAAQRLSHGRWAYLPAAPVQLGDDASVVWTGRDLIVWGGQSGGLHPTLIGGGARYDATAHRWAALPPAPISPRTGQATAWTGKEMIVWGGYDQPGPDAVPTADGAAYNPTTDGWRRLPRGPLAAAAGGIALWTGHEVILSSTWKNDGSPGHLSTFQTDLAAYNPATNTWRSLPGVPKGAGEDINRITGTAAGSSLLITVSWGTARDRLIPMGPPRGTGSGTRTYLFDPSTERWKLVSSTRSGLARAVFDPVWTGTHLIFVEDDECLPCAGGVRSTPLPTYSFEPGTERFRILATDPAQGTGIPASAWTGKMLLRVGTGTGAFDPGSNAWTVLPAPPKGATPSLAFWTGQELLVWGHTGRRVGGYRYVP
jgi:hypothetical protein